MRRKHLVSLVVLIFLTWNILMYYFLVSKNPTKNENRVLVSDKLRWLQNDIEKQLRDNEKLLEDLRQIKDDTVKKEKANRLKTHGVEDTDPATHKIAVLMFSCDRTTVSRSLDSLLKIRPKGDRFPIVVSQDCGHKPTSDVIQTYVKKEKGLVTHIKHPNLTDINLPSPKKKFKGYYKIARHYKWALDQIFHKFNYTAVIIVEDDLEYSPDFFEYFSATYQILKADPTLWCVSAWNDNGKSGMVSDDPELLYRSDFFPGLGWMLEKHVWLELSPKWPDSFWDDWMRHPDQRKNRVCIRPEICRTSTFGKKGVSKGLFYDKHLKFIKLNEKPIDFTKKDLTYLIKENYDPTFHKMVYETPLASVTDVITLRKRTLPALRVQYSSKEEFKSAAKQLKIMEDFKAGVPRVAYRGVVSFMRSGQRIYLAPPEGWTGYDTTWT
ncbi:alpha-1,3-mannosyl-glycoprotein 2-beta-N-acetylglucosaminyltransferase-like isoform X1 [Mytilus californianus]|uniref:alpha-1,3-mannosyl-glycoprotein 2-beta-N-acetylglucosaminyltransferase-like isoform X1 n=1 Tax=Mytilus californianus TaxID=6549 RepID=UPI002246971B|nr:alpha-1,3-mannosyl-glycoprotein 2-beta-N-acetylglucosaminyltransferase-like isoform X1 [Mytilus californianus]